VDSLTLFATIPAGLDLGSLDDLIPGSARKVVLDVPFQSEKHPVSVIVLRLPDGGVRVYGNRCAHFGIPLDVAADYPFLSPDGSTLRCQHHYADYALEDGRGLSRDCAGEGLPSVSFEIKDGRIITASV
jgi:nitrite reductase/ring-hydroxylating ferredoxin subunit